VFLGSAHLMNPRNDDAWSNNRLVSSGLLLLADAKSVAGHRRGTDK
jgi:hypothetical protein